MRAHHILQLRFPVLRYSISPLFSISTPRPKTLSRQKTEAQFTIRIENSLSKSYSVCPKEIYTHPRNSLDKVGSDLWKLLCRALGLFCVFNLKGKQFLLWRCLCPLSASRIATLNTSIKVFFFLISNFPDSVALLH
jgi:hypothetical protein